MPRVVFDITSGECCERAELRTWNSSLGEFKDVSDWRDAELEEYKNAL